jgi:hypothetical protein
MCKYFVALLLGFGPIGSCIAVNLNHCDGQPEIERFQQLLEKARHCKVHADCIVAPFHGAGRADGYGYGAPINKSELDSLSKEDKLLPKCDWGLCECLLLSVEAVVCEMNQCTIKYGPYKHPEAFDPTSETLDGPDTN